MKRGGVRGVEGGNKMQKGGHLVSFLDATTVVVSRMERFADERQCLATGRFPREQGFQHAGRKPQACCVLVIFAKPEDGLAMHSDLLRCAVFEADILPDLLQGDRVVEGGHLLVEGHGKRGRAEREHFSCLSGIFGGGGRRAPAGDDDDRSPTMIDKIRLKVPPRREGSSRLSSNTGV